MLSLTIAVPKETEPGENRVALVPKEVGRLAESGMSVVVESGVGLGADYRDRGYEKAGALVVIETAALYEKADVI